jgi:hypothetical protein
MEPVFLNARHANAGTRQAERTVAPMTHAARYRLGWSPVRIEARTVAARADDPLRSWWSKSVFFRLFRL